MTRPAIILLALLGLLLLGRLDRDGVIARANVAARAVGLEVRVEVRVQRAGAASHPDCRRVDGVAWVDVAEGRVRCE